jgi:hypothetical protein
MIWHPEFHRSISLLDKEKIVLTMILYEVCELGLMREEQFGFRPIHSTSLQLARLVERITKNTGEKRLTSAVFLDVAKAYDTIWIDCLLYKLTIQNSRPTLSIQSHLNFWVGRLRRPSRRPRHLFEACGLGGAWWIHLPCTLQSVCQRHAHSIASRRVARTTRPS